MPPTRSTRSTTRKTDASSDEAPDISAEKPVARKKPARKAAASKLSKDSDSAFSSQDDLSASSGAKIAVPETSGKVKQRKTRGRIVVDADSSDADLKPSASVPVVSNQTAVKPKIPLGFLVNWSMLLFCSWMFLVWTPSFAFNYLIAVLLSFEAYRLASNKNHRRLLKTSPQVQIMFLILGLLMSMVFHSTFRLVLFDDYSDVAFSRVGMVTPTSASIFIRYPNLESGASLRLYSRVAGQNHSTKLGPSVELSLDSDFTGKVTLDGLQPSTKYEYAWVGSNEGVVKVVTFYNNGRGIGPALMDRLCVAVGLEVAVPRVEEWSTLVTAPPSNQATSFRLVFGSCLRPNFPYGKGLPGFAEIAKHNPDLIMMLGDFIYVDGSLSFGSSLANFRRHYREVFGQCETTYLSSVPMLAIPDDHEILNDWHHGQNHTRFQNAMTAFGEYLGTVDGDYSNGLYFSFERGNVAFFVLDTRSFRNCSEGNRASSERTMLGSIQKKKFKEWLLAVKDTHPVKIIATSVPFAFNFWNEETWFGYQHERLELTDFIQTHKIRGVVFISGDRHQVGVSEIVYGGDDVETVKIFDVSVSPINQFSVPFPYFFTAYNTPSLSEPPTDQKLTKLFNESAWIMDKPVFYTPYAGQIVVGRLDVDTTGKHKDLCASGNSVAICIFKPDAEHMQETGPCQGPGELVYAQVICA